MTKIKIWEWLEKQGYQTDYDENEEYKMYYVLDMPKILNAFCEYQKTVEEE